MTTGLNDLLGVLAVAFYLAGMAAVTVRAVMLRNRQQSDRGRGGVAALFLVTGFVYVLFILLEAPTVMTVLTNRVDDIPPASSLRAFTFGVWLWLLHMLLFRLARGRLK